VPSSQTLPAQLSLPLQAEPQTAPRRDAIAVEGALVPLRFVRHARARRYVLRVSRQGEAVVTVPRRGSLREARRFAEAHRAWIARERSAHAEAIARARPLGIGDAVLFRGSPRAILPGDPHVLLIDGMSVPLASGGVHEAVRAWLKAEARAVLPSRLRALAAAHGLAVRAVSIRNQRTRWGSCSSDGRISLNWRLVQMPDDVRDYVLLHELMHLKVRNHSPRFWREVQKVCPDYERARLWLRERGQELL
jgi:predicted metal-dependent hydrolase